MSWRDPLSDGNGLLDVDDAGMSSTLSPITGKREWPVSRVALITVATGADARTVRTRVRGVMTSAAVFAPKVSERSIGPAVSEPTAPWRPARRTTDAQLVRVRAERSSSTGSTPTRRSSWFAVPFSTAISGRVTLVNTNSGITTHTTLPAGRDKAMFSALARRTPSAPRWLKATPEQRCHICDIGIKPERVER